MLKHFFSFVILILCHFTAALTANNSAKCIPFYGSSLNLTVNDIECYKNVMEFISNNQEFRKGFEFLARKKKLGKRYFKDGKYKLKVSDQIYSPDLNQTTVPCIISSLHHLDKEMKLSQLSVCQNGYKFVLFFSGLTDHYLECKIVVSVDPKIDNYYYPRTSFGNVMNLKFCIEDNQVISHNMQLSMVN